MHNNEGDMHGSLQPLELWGGIECTHNRVGDTYLDQLDRSGHAGRLDDLERIARLGIRTVRYPLLWERIAFARDPEAAWRWADERMGELRRLELTPIIGLLHHGSGPRDTSLLDPAMPQGLAAFAADVSRRYPWARAYTPVNEPLTTARFCGLYGHWYPHLRHDRAFAAAALNQCRATILAMREIRRVQPAAILVQTDDLGRTHARPRVAYQARFDNERRWLAWDLLMGRVARGHYLWKYLLVNGIEEEELRWIEENACPPDILGVNHYVTSDRYLDERVGMYPEWSRGGNRRMAYADVPAARALLRGPARIESLLAEAWKRYGRALAITECHLGGPRDEQMRWLKEIWDGALCARSRGVDVRAVTVWSLFGSFDWNSLVTRATGYYEPGPYDVRAPQPRATALARLVQRLATSQPVAEPVLDAPGWWRRDDRFQFGPLALKSRRPFRPERRRSSTARGIRIVGGDLPLGAALQAACHERALACQTQPIEAADVPESYSAPEAEFRDEPWAVVLAIPTAQSAGAGNEARRLRAAWSVVVERALVAYGRKGAALMAVTAVGAARGGERASGEPDLGEPNDKAERWCADIERRLACESAGALVIGCGRLLCPWDEGDEVRRALGMLAQGVPVHVDDPSAVAFTHVADAMNIALDLLIDGECGVWPMVHPETLTMGELLRELARRCRLNPALVRDVAASRDDPERAAPPEAPSRDRPGGLMPPIDSALAAYVRVVEEQSELRSEHCAVPA